MNPRPKFLVIGSAHLDILGHVMGDGSAIDKIGRVSIEIGGTACNIAINLANMGACVRMLTAFNTSPYSKVVAQYIQDNNIDLLVHQDAQLPDSAFCAHINRDGEMFSAISATAVETVSFRDEEIQLALYGVDGCIADCNLSEHSLRQIALMCEKVRIPLYAAAVAEEKSLRLLSIAHSTMLRCVFMNYAEATYLFRYAHMSAHMSRIDNDNTHDSGISIDSKEKWNHLIKKVGSPFLVISIGRDGALLVENDNLTHICGRRIGGAQEMISNTLGSGDMLLAKTVLEITKSVPEHIALAMGVEEAVRICTHRHCNSGSGDALRSTIGNLDKKAHRDVLTGLYNRQAGEDMLRRASKREGTFILVADIDHFKSVNDTFGHTAGDMVLKEVACAMELSIRDGDMAVRWGGEEFVCILLTFDLNEAVLAAERIRKNIGEAVRRPDGSPLTISIGVAPLLQDIDVSFAMADEALYEAKRSGRNRVVSREMVLAAA